MRKNYILLIGLIIFLSLGIVFYGKSTLHHVNNDQLLQARYTTDHNYTFVNMGYDPITLEDQGIEPTADNLFNHSDLILVIETSEQSEYLGKSVRNKCRVKKVISGEYNQEYVYIQNFILNWSTNCISAFGNLSPLKQGEEYLVFLSEAKYAINQNDYFFSSYTYGHINMSNSKFMVWNEPISVEEASEYDCVFYREQIDDTDLDIYQATTSEIMNRV